MTLRLRKLPCQSSGKWRELTRPVAGQGREGRFQSSLMEACLPSESQPLMAGPK